MAQYPRWQSSSTQQALQTRRVLILAGARQCGKTTLAKALATPDAEYRTLDDSALLQAAQQDPPEFVKRHGHLLIIDEIQKAVELLPAIKKQVDEDPTPGQYLLTGSANIQSLPGVTESLAGRVRKIVLRPLAQGEVLGNSPRFLDHLSQESLSALRAPSVTRDDIIAIALRGGYPEALNFTVKERTLWHRDYAEALLERDLKDIVNIRRHESMHQLLEIACTWSTQLIDISSIGRGLAIQRPTVETYLNALETLYLLDRIPAWTKTDYARVGSQQKLIMNDSGFMASMLGWQAKDIRFDSDRIGKLIETHVGNELQKHISTSDDLYTLYHYRDREKREIDFILERDDGHLVGIEVKASTSVGLNDFKHLRWFKEQLLPAKTPMIGLVLYAGTHTLSFGDGLWAVPIGMLY